MLVNECVSRLGRLHHHRLQRREHAARQAVQLELRHQVQLQLELSERQKVLGKSVYAFITK